MNFYGTVVQSGISEEVVWDDFEFELSAALSAAAALGKPEERQVAAEARRMVAAVREQPEADIAALPTPSGRETQTQKSRKQTRQPRAKPCAFCSASSQCQPEDSPEKLSGQNQPRTDCWSTRSDKTGSATRPPWEPSVP